MYSQNCMDIIEFEIALIVIHLVIHHVIKIQVENRVVIPMYKVIFLLYRKGIWQNFKEEFSVEKEQENHLAI